MSNPVATGKLPVPAVYVDSLALPAQVSAIVLQLLQLLPNLQRKMSGAAHVSACLFEKKISNLRIYGLPAYKD
jgi:hypothetical protein